MKSHKQICVFISLFVAVFTLSPAAQGAGEKEGGSLHGGGGGQFSADGKISLLYFESLVARAREVLPLVFNALELGDRGQDIDADSGRITLSKEFKLKLPALYGKLFNSSGPTVFEILPKVQYEVRKTDACHHPQRPGELPGSAHVGSSEFLICLSYDQAKREINSGNAETKLMGLMAHEASHLLGSSEAEAEALQVLVEAQVSARILTDFPDIRNQMNFSFQLLKEKILEIQGGLSKPSRNSALLSLAPMHGLFDFLRDRRDYSAGFSFFNRREEARARALVVQGITMNIFALKDLQGQEIDDGRQLVAGWLEGKNEIAAGAIYLKVARKEGTPFFLSDFDQQDLIYNLEGKEAEALSLQLASTLRIVNFLREKVQAGLVP